MHFAPLVVSETCAPTGRSGYPEQLRSAPRLLEAAAELLGRMMDGTAAEEMEQQMRDAGWDDSTGEQCV
jgi:hypothetical protein